MTRFVAFGVPTIGRLTRWEITGHGPEQRIRTPIIEYQNQDNQSVEKRLGFSGGEFSHCKIGDTLQIIYLEGVGYVLPQGISGLVTRPLIAFFLLLVALIGLAVVIAPKIS